MKDWKIGRSNNKSNGHLLGGAYIDLMDIFTRIER